RATAGLRGDLAAHRARHDGLCSAAHARKIGRADPPLLADPDGADLARLDQAIDRARRDSKEVRSLANSDQVVGHLRIPPYFDASMSVSCVVRRPRTTSASVDRHAFVSTTPPTPL